MIMTKVYGKLESLERYRDNVFALGNSLILGINTTFPLSLLSTFYPC